MAFILEEAEMKIGRRRSVTYLGEILYLLWSLLTSTGTGAQLYACPFFYSTRCVVISITLLVLSSVHPMLR